MNKHQIMGIMALCLNSGLSFQDQRTYLIIVLFYLAHQRPPTPREGLNLTGLMPEFAKQAKFRLMDADLIDDEWRPIGIQGGME